MINEYLLSLIKILYLKSMINSLILIMLFGYVNKLFYRCGHAAIIFNIAIMLYNLV